MKLPYRKFILLVTAFYGKRFVHQTLRISTGYAAKFMCTAIFSSGRKASQVKQNELNFFPVNLNRYQIDYEQKSVTASLWGIVKQTAVYREKMGSCLLSSDKDRNLRLFPALTPQPATMNKRQEIWPKGDIIPWDYSQKNWHKQLKTSVNTYFDPPGEIAQQKTSAVAVMQNNELIYEQYAPGYNMHTPLPGWSMTKSVINALIGILVQKGKLDVYQPIGLQEWKQDRRKNITIHHLLQMTSGLQWQEHYMHISAVTRMLFLEKNIPGFAIERKSAYPAGKRWAYASGSTNVLCELIRRKINDDQAYWQFPQKSLFQSINADSFFIETDSQGTFVGSSYAAATARDWLRFGMLYLNDGCWEGRQLLPEGWVRYSSRPSVASEGQYGAHFWVNASGELLPDAPRDTYMAQGYDGQRLFIVPSRNAVILRTGYSKERFDYNAFLKDVLACLPE